MMIVHEHGGVTNVDAAGWRGDMKKRWPLKASVEFFIQKPAYSADVAIVTECCVEFDHE